MKIFTNWSNFLYILRHTALLKYLNLLVFLDNHSKIELTNTILLFNEYYEVDYINYKLWSILIILFFPSWLELLSSSTICQVSGQAYLSNIFSDGLLNWPVYDPNIMPLCWILFVLVPFCPQLIKMVKFQGWAGLHHANGGYMIWT